jgi:hypothetical protein
MTDLEQQTLYNLVKGLGVDAVLDEIADICDQLAENEKHDGFKRVGARCISAAALARTERLVPNA